MRSSVLCALLQRSSCLRGWLRPCLRRFGGLWRALASASTSVRSKRRSPEAAGLRRKLTAALRPLHLSVLNESHLHAGHAGNPGGGPDAETHFRVEIVSDAFAGLTPVARHRLVYDALRTELAEGLHALALKTRTAAEAGLPR